MFTSEISHLANLIYLLLSSRRNRFNRSRSILQRETNGNPRNARLEELGFLFKFNYEGAAQVTNYRMN